MPAYPLNNLLAEPGSSGQSFINPSYTAFTQTVRNFCCTPNASKDVPRIDFGSREPTVDGVSSFSGEMDPFAAAVLICFALTQKN